jgi:hypothetical protein
MFSHGNSFYQKGRISMRTDRYSAGSGNHRTGHRRRRNAHTPSSSTDRAFIFVHPSSIVAPNPTKMPPKKPPSQAGKFKPLMRPAKKPDVPPPVAASAPAASASAASSSSSAASGRGGRTPDAAGRGEGRGRGGRDGRFAGGRVGGRDGRFAGGRGGRGGGGGRFVIPTGRAFFTGEAAKRSGGEAAGGGGGGLSSSSSRDAARGTGVIPAGADGAVVMPGMAGVSSSSSSSSGGGGGFGVARSAAESMAAAARAKAGEGEEFIVAEMLDLDEEFGEDDGGGGKKKRSVLDGPSRSQRFDGMPSLFDDENRTEDYGGGERADRDGISDAFVYDSDSSAEEMRARRGGGKGQDPRGGLPPTQLPFPGAPHQPTMYDCQEYDGDDGEEKKTPDPVATSSSSVGAAASASYSKLSDPPLRSPFLDLASLSAELNNQMETRNSWFLMKFPTRLPHLDASSASSSASKKKAARIKSELFDEFDIAPDVVESSPHADTIASGDAGALASVTASSGALGYDDTLKDAPAGRYGRIVVRKSGKTELIIGGGGDGREVRKVPRFYVLSSRFPSSRRFTIRFSCFFDISLSKVRLLVHEGLQCGFRQEAVCIDPDSATFVSLGSVDKSLVVTPDIERAFVVS